MTGKNALNMEAYFFFLNQDNSNPGQVYICDFREENKDYLDMSLSSIWRLNNESNCSVLFQWPF